MKDDTTKSKLKSTMRMKHIIWPFKTSELGKLNVNLNLHWNNAYLSSKTGNCLWVVMIIFILFNVASSHGRSLFYLALYYMYAIVPWLATCKWQIKL